jgi:hypothetical protein
MQWILLLVGVYICAWFIEDKNPEAQAQAKAWADRVGKRLLFVLAIFLCFGILLEWLDADQQTANSNKRVEQAQVPTSPAS